jgi:uncharacterized membrane protein YbhN (UPF0104 family)
MTTHGMKSFHGMKSAFWSVVKYLLAVTLLVIILKHAKTDTVIEDLRKIPPLRLLFAFGLISLAQIAGAMRMRFFFHAAGFYLNARFATILYYVGAFYNFLLPGGIGGDAYKVILVRKRLNVTTKQGVLIMLADRASGLCVIMLTMFGALLTLDFSTIPYASPLIVLCMAITVAGYLFFSYLLFKLPPLAMLGSLPYSLATQALWVAGLLTVWAPLSGGRHAVEYIALYCAASITGMLPISVGGLGVKETTYFYGAGLLQTYAHSSVDGNLGIAISLCMFFLMLAASLPGLLWLNKVEKAHFA